MDDLEKQKRTETWHIPLGQSGTLAKSVEGMEDFRLKQSEIPWIIRLVENPKYKNGWLGRLFPGRVSLKAHDCIHVILGRGLLLKDEAFVVGFTMGSTGLMNGWKERLFLTMTRLFYPKGYRFFRQEALVFRMGVAFAELLPCKDLTTVDFAPHMGKKIEAIRKELEIDSKLLTNLYEVEKTLFPDSPESQRLTYFNG